MPQYNPFKLTKSNNRKETKGRTFHKQYIPLYTTDKKGREKLVARWKEEGVPSYEIERRLRQKSLVLHESA